MRSISTDSACIARQRSSDRPVTFEYFTPASGLNSNVVTTGPGWIWTTEPSTENSRHFSSSRRADSISSRSSIFRSGFGGSSSVGGGSVKSPMRRSAGERSGSGSGSGGIDGSRGGAFFWRTGGVGARARLVVARRRRRCSARRRRLGRDRRGPLGAGGLGRLRGLRRLGLAVLRQHLAALPGLAALLAPGADAVAGPLGGAGRCRRTAREQARRTRTASPESRRRRSASAARSPSRCGSGTRTSGRRATRRRSRRRGRRAGRSPRGRA